VNSSVEFTDLDGVFGCCFVDCKACLLADLEAFERVEIVADIDQKVSVDLSGDRGAVSLECRASLDCRDLDLINFSANECCEPGIGVSEI